MKISPVGNALIHAYKQKDRRTDITKLIGAFRYVLERA